MKEVVLPRNAVYKKLWNAKERFLLLKGGVGSGKSIAAAQWMIEKLVTQPGSNFLVTRKIARTNRFSTFALLKQVVYASGLEKVIQAKENNTSFVAYNGNEILCEGLDDPLKIKSITFSKGILTGIWVEEASETTEHDFKHLNMRLRGITDVPLQMLFTFNPIHCWIKDYFYDNPKENTFMLSTTYKDNQYIDEEYRRQLEALKHTDPLLYEINALGEWAECGEQVFHNVVFEEVCHDISYYDCVCIGMDFGFNHHTAIEMIGIKDNELYSFNEVYVKEMLMPQIMKIAESILPKHMLVFADSAEPRTIADWQAAGYCVVGVDKHRPDFVKSGFNFLKVHRWHIDKNMCPGLAEEVKNATYRKDSHGDLTEDVFSFHDDALAASRYAINELIETQFFSTKKASIFEPVNVM